MLGILNNAYVIIVDAGEHNEHNAWRRINRMATNYIIRGLWFSLSRGLFVLINII